MGAGPGAQIAYVRDRDYVVVDDELVIVDEFTGRMMPGRRWRDGLHQAIEAKERLDINQFIVRHPTTLFQCLWNTAWWYDCLEAERYYTWPGESRDPPPWHRPGPKLSDRLEAWRMAKESAAPGFVWLRSLRPPPIGLGAGPPAILKVHERAVWSVAFSPDGRRFATGTEDGTAQVWDSETGAEVARLVAHDGPVNRVAFSPDGRRLAIESFAGTARVWDTDTGSCVEAIRDRSDVQAMAGGPETFPLRAVRRVPETVIEAATGSGEVAWFPVALGHLATHPSGRMWAGSVDRFYVTIIRLEGETKPWESRKDPGPTG